MKRRKIVPLTHPHGRVLDFGVKTQLDQPWREAIEKAGPDTPTSDEVWGAGINFEPIGTGLWEGRLVLINFPRHGGWRDATDWAEEHNLVSADPRRVFSFWGERKYILPTDECIIVPEVVSPEDCTIDGVRQACSLWLYDLAPRARISPIYRFSTGGLEYWFAFRKNE